MVHSRWHSRIHGGIALCDDETIVTAPRFCDGNWRGGWWARYDIANGNCLWKVKHRRGAKVTDILDDVIVATTHKCSGVYAISLKTGSRLWSRLGDRFDLLLKLCDLLPADNEGISPERIWKNGVLTRCGRLLNLETGRVVSRHNLKYSRGNPVKLLEVDQHEVSSFISIRHRDCLPIHDYAKQPAINMLKQHGLCLASYYPCILESHEVTVCVACSPPKGFEADANLRFSRDGPKDECDHFLVVADSGCSTIHNKLSLGRYYTAELDWASDSFFSVTAQSLQQWQWTYERDFWLFGWNDLK